MVDCGLKTLSGERGAVTIVEAALVYPIVIFVVIIFLMLGNVFYQQSKIDSLVVRAAERLASYYTNPMLIEDSLPTNAETIEVYPYRYLFGDAGAEAATKQYIEDGLSGTGSGLFSGMEIVLEGTPVCKINNYILYQTASVEINYSINFYPLKLIGGIPLIKQTVAASTSASDPAEFMRDIDMILDYSEKSGLSDKIRTTVGQFTGN